MTKQIFFRWLAIAAGGCLITYAAQAPVTITILLALQAIGSYEDATWPYFLGFAVILLIGAIFWLKRYVSNKIIIEYSTLAAGTLFLISAVGMVVISLYEALNGQQASDPAGPALAAALIVVFVAAQLVQAALCLTVGLWLRRRRRRDVS